MCHTGTTNTVPNAFSMLAFVLGDRDLGEEISEEVKGVVTRTITDGVDYVKTDTTALVGEKCPTLESAYFEMLRLDVSATSVRVMTEDLTLNEKYHLAKGGIVQIAAGAMHESNKVWGDDVDVYNGRRFLSKNLTSEQKKNLLPFGGGKHLCPGRHLAQTEIMSFAAMVLYGFEVKLRDGSGLVKHPGFEVPSLGQNSKKPVHDVEVLIKRKEEFRDVVWVFEV